MKNSYLFLIATVLFSSCSNDMRFGKGEIHSAEKKFLAVSNSIPKRDLAQTRVDSCVTDEVTEEKLLQEIKVLENKTLVSSKSIIGSIDLSKFSPSQANFIEKNKEWIYTKGLDFSECSDVKCLFSKIYPNSDGYEGYVNYYIYLKMGYILSTVKNVPGVNLDNFADQDILFSRDELKSFYYLAKSLGPSFQKVSTLTSLHRMPKRTSLPAYDRACGLAGGPVNKGYVILMDECLIKGVPQKIAGSFFYPAGTHEIAHRLDFALLPNYARFSETQTWLDLSGWYIKENLDPTTGRAISRAWAKQEPLDPKNKNDGFVRDYAATSPIEDFADSVGYGRFEADNVLSVSPRKYAWITQNLFNGRSYANNGLTESYSNFLINYSMNELPTVINNCVANHSSYTYTISKTQLEEYKNYDPELIQCIFGGVSKNLEVGLRDLKANELEACSYFAKSESLIKTKVMNGMNDFIKKDLNKNVEIGTQLKVLSEFITRLSDEVDPREIFVACQEEKSPMDCYSRELKVSFDKSAADYNDKIPNQLKSYEESYFKDNSYVSVRGGIASLFSQIYMGSEAKFKDEANKRWKNCFANSSQESLEDNSELLLYPYNGGDQFIKKSLLNCLNKDAEDQLQSILDKIGKKFSITISNPSTKRFILEIYLSSYTSALQSLVAVEAKQEAIKVNEIKKQYNDKILSSLTKDVSWVGQEPRTNDELFKLCSEQATKILDANTSLSVSSSLRFHASMGNLGNPVDCRSIASNSNVRLVNEDNQNRVIKESFNKLNAIFLEKIAPLMVKCKSQFNKNNAVFIKSRNLCLTNPYAWDGVVDKAIESWLSSENFNFISSARRKGSDYLNAKKSELKETAIKQMNK